MQLDLGTRSWTTFRAYTHGDLDGLMRQAGGALLRAAEEHATPAILSRHWAGGPHLSLHLGTQPDSPLPGELAAQLRAAVQPCLAAASPQLNLRQHSRARYEQQAEREQYRGEFWPLQAHGTLALLGRERTIGLRGARPVEHLMDDASMALNNLTLEVLHLVAAGHSLLELCFELMVASINGTASGWDVDNGFVSYRSHAEIFLIQVPDHFRAQFAQRSAANQGALRALLHGVVSGQSRHEALLARWRSVLGRLYGVAWTLLQEGHADLSWEGQDFSLDRPELGAAVERSMRSPFHRLELANPRHMEARSRDVSFNAFRLLLNAGYLQFSRFGLVPLQRALLCHLVADTVEDVYGVDALTLISRYAYLPPTPA